MTKHFVSLASYNSWANRRLLAALLELSEEQRGRDVGLFFRSLRKTMEHILDVDVIWISRMSKQSVGSDVAGWRSSPDFGSVVNARIQVDELLSEFVSSISDDSLASHISYSTRAGQTVSEPLWATLMHIFNHQTHHRGQMHAGMLVLTGCEPVPLDYWLFRHGATAPSVEEVISSI